MSDKKKAQEAEELFPNGPTQEQVDNWKKQYGVIEALQVGGEYYIYRQLTRAEHHTLLASGALDVEDHEAATVKNQLLFPTFEEVDWDSRAGGTIPSLAQAISRLSGFIPESAPIKL